jgi:spore coat polysaccharide biosynthesis protein SpsF
MNLAILQARMTSSRLPGKVLRDVAGAPMIVRQIERLRRARSLDRLVVATSVEASDDGLADRLQSLGVEVHRGPLGDVLGRFCGALEAFGPADPVVRLTADCPLADPEVIDQLLALHAEQDADYSFVGGATRTHPHGLDAEVIRAEVLALMGREAADPYEREHVTPFIYRNPQRFRIAELKSPVDRGGLRWTVDVPDDLVFVQAVYAALYPERPAFSSEDVVRFVAARADLAQLGGFRRG